MKGTVPIAVRDLAEFADEMNPKVWELLNKLVETYDPETQVVHLFVDMSRTPTRHEVGLRSWLSFEDSQDVEFFNRLIHEMVIARLDEN